MNATLTAASRPLPAAAGTARATGASLPSAKWTPALRSYVNGALAKFVGEDDVTKAFASPRECAEYYGRYLIDHRPELDIVDADDLATPLGFVDYLDALDGSASEHWAPDCTATETSTNGLAMARGLTMAEASEHTPVRFTRINDRQYPRFRK